MISLGSVRWGTENPNIQLSFAYEKERSGADMKYRAQITVATLSGASYFGYPIYFKLSIGGTERVSTTLKNASPSQWTSAITYTSPWYTISNKTTGTTAVSFNVYSGMGSSRSGTYSYKMDVDPAASKISASNGTLGTALTLTLTRYNSDFTDTITYKCGTVSGTVVSDSTKGSVSWSTSNGNTLDLSSQNTTGTSVNVTLTVTTYSGSTKVGTNSTTVTMAIPSSVKPSVALSITDAAGYQSTYGAFVQGYSKLKITATPTLAHESPIKKYVITAEGKSYSTALVTTAAVRSKGTRAVTATVTDARSRSSDTVSQDITVLEYSKPVVTLSAYRCTSDGTKDAEGAYMKIVVTSTISSLNGRNSATYSVEYADGGAVGTGTSYTSKAIACDVSTAHAVKVTVADKLSSTTKTTTVPVAYILQDYHNTGKGIAFGKLATRTGFDCGMSAYFTKGIKANMLTSADDLDNIKVNGWYRWTWDDRPINAPSYTGTQYMRSMRVWTCNELECCQEVIDMTNSSRRGCIVRRTIYDVTPYPWEWVNPPMELGVEYRTVQRHLGKAVHTKMISLGTLPNSSSKTVAISLPSNASLVSFTAYAKKTGSTLTQQIPLISTSGATNAKVQLTSSNAEVYTFADLSSYEGYVTVNYTID